MAQGQRREAAGPYRTRALLEDEHRASVQNQWRRGFQYGTVLEAQPLVRGKHISLGPVGGKLNTPGSRGRTERESERTARALGRQLGELDTACTHWRVRGPELRRWLRSPRFCRIARDDANIG